MGWDINQRTNLLLGLFIASLMMANLLGTKITSFELTPILAMPLNFIFFPVVYILNIFLHSIGGNAVPVNFFDTVHVSVGILTVTLLFLITDIVEEVHGKKKVREFILIGIISMLVAIVIAQLSVIAPPAERYTKNDAYVQIFSSSIRIMLASISAFVIAQLHDMWAFQFWKKKTKGKRLWQRSDFSTIVSMLIDSTVFMFIAFYKITPQWDTVFIISLIIPYWIFKILFSLLNGVVIYPAVSWLRGTRKSAK